MSTGLYYPTRNSDFEASVHPASALHKWDEEYRWDEAILGKQGREISSTLNCFPSTAAQDGGCHLWAPSAVRSSCCLRGLSSCPAAVTALQAPTQVVVGIRVEKRVPEAEVLEFSPQF